MTEKAQTLLTLFIKINRYLIHYIKNISYKFLNYNIKCYFMSYFVFVIFKFTSINYKYINITHYSCFFILCHKVWKILIVYRHNTKVENHCSTVYINFVNNLLSTNVSCIDYQKIYFIKYFYIFFVQLYAFLF